MNQIVIFSSTQTERMLYVLFEERWRDIANDILSRPVVHIKLAPQSWISYISGLGMSFVNATSLPQPRDPENENHYVVDPASHFDAYYIVVGPELAMKILTLGGLP